MATVMSCWSKRQYCLLVKWAGTAFWLSMTALLSCKIHRQIRQSVAQSYVDIVYTLCVKLPNHQFITMCIYREPDKNLPRSVCIPNYRPGRTPRLHCVHSTLAVYECVWIIPLFLFSNFVDHLVSSARLTITHIFCLQSEATNLQFV